MRVEVRRSVPRAATLPDGTGPDHPGCGRSRWHTDEVLQRFVATVFYADVAVGLDLFVDGLGMTVVHRDGGFVVLARDGAKIQLAEDAEAAAHAERPELGLEVADVHALEALHADVAARRPDLLHPNLREPTDRPWGAREFALLDATTVCVVVRAWPS